MKTIKFFRLQIVHWDICDNRRIANDCAILGHLNFLLSKWKSYHATLCSRFLIMLHYGPRLDGSCSIYFCVYQQYLIITFHNFQHIGIKLPFSINMNTWHLQILGVTSSYLDNQVIGFKCSTHYCFIGLIDYLDWRTILD